jgi:hypothetical protein
MGRQAEITDSGINRWTGGGPDRNPVPGRDENAPVHLQSRETGSLEGQRQSGRRTSQKSVLAMMKIGEVRTEKRSFLFLVI